MSFLKKLFGKKEEVKKEEVKKEEVKKQEVKKEESKIATVSNGELVELSEVPDEVFAQKMMGDGFAMKTSDGVIVSPVDGKVENVFPTKHALGITTKDGKEVLLHLGVDTVNLKGQGFEVFVNEGQEVKIGDKLVKMDVEFIENSEEAKSSMPIVVFTNLQEGESVKLKTGSTTAGELDRIEIVK